MDRNNLQVMVAVSSLSWGTDLSNVWTSLTMSGAVLAFVGLSIEEALHASETRRMNKGPEPLCETRATGCTQVTTWGLDPTFGRFQNSEHHCSEIRITPLCGLAGASP
jgi:hypothetical protein